MLLPATEVVEEDDIFTAVLPIYLRKGSAEITQRGYLEAVFEIAMDQESCCFAPCP
jgi:hypothetical protein